MPAFPGIPIEESPKNARFLGAPVNLESVQSEGVPLSETPVDQLQEIGAAPELNNIFDLRGLKAGLASNLMSDPEELSSTLTKIYPESKMVVGPDATLRIQMPSGEYVVNAPGVSGQDLAQFTARLLTFAATKGRSGASVSTLIKTGGEAAAIEAGLQGVEKSLGGEFDATPIALTGAVSAAGQAIPSAFKGVVNLVRNAQARKILTETAPTIEKLKDAASSIYQQVDDIGIKLKPSIYKNTIDNLAKTLQKEGLRAELTPESAKLLQVLKGEPLDKMTASNLYTLRKIASGVASNKNISEADARLAGMAVDSIDDLIENLDQYVVVPKGVNSIAGQPVSSALRDARVLWGKAKRSEIIKKTIEMADTRRAGTDLGLRNEFATLHRKITNGSVKGFNKEEVEAIKQVANGGNLQNMVFQLGRLGVPEDQATNTLMVSLVGGTAGISGFAAGGPGGAAAGVTLAVGIPSLFRRAATKMTQSNAQLADDIVRSSDDALGIVKAYLKHTPKAQRNSADLAALLFNSGAKPGSLKQTGNHLIDNAIFGFQNALKIEASKEGERQ